MNIIRTHNVFLNTAQPTSGSAHRARFQVPSGVLKAGPGKQLRVSLGSFSMKSNAIEHIDSNSNSFFVVLKLANGVVTSQAAALSVGNYHRLDGDEGLAQEMETRISDACNALRAGMGATVTYHNLTGKIRVTYTNMPVGSAIKLVCFALRGSENLPSLFATILQGAAQNQIFSSAFEIFGGAAQILDSNVSGTDAEQFNALTNMLDSMGPIAVSLLGIRDSYLENLYIRTNLPNSNWQSADYSTTRLPTFQPSAILAKIPIPREEPDYIRYAEDAHGDLAEEGQSHASRGRQNLHWQDGGSKIWSQTLAVESVNDLEISICDEYGRVIPLPSVVGGERLGGCEIALVVDVLA